MTIFFRKLESDHGKTIYWAGYCHDERIPGISKVEQIVNKYGYITDFKKFSDVSLSLHIELEESKINYLYEELRKYLKLDEVKPCDSSSGRERVIFLSITFKSGQGYLSHEVPAVPG